MLRTSKKFKNYPKVYCRCLRFQVDCMDGGWLMWDWGLVGRVGFLYLWGTSLLVVSHLFTVHFSFLFRDPSLGSKAGGTEYGGQVDR